jgi:cytochrome c553
MFTTVGARCGSRFAKQQSVTSAQRDLLNTMREADEVTHRCALAVSAVRRSLCLFLGLLCAAPPGQAAGFNFASLQSLLSQQNIGSVEQLLAALPAAQRNRYALVFESRSLQGASLENPRVILYGPDARFIVTFNGGPAQRGFRVVETMEFDDESQEFRLRELLFPERAAGVDKVVVSEVNPERCARCHGAPAQPVWDTFPLWPGAYGEHYRANLSARERAGLSAFLALQATHPRYGELLGANRFADPHTFRSSAHGQYAGIPVEPPNAELAIYLSRLQAQSITRQLVRQPAFDLYRYALLGLADNACGRLADFYPDALWRTQRHGFERFARDTSVTNARQAQLKAARAAITGGAAVAADRTPSDDALVQLRFVAESALGVATQNWTLALEKGTYDFTMPPLPAQPLREALLAELARRDTVIQDLSFYSTSSDGDRYCSYLKRRSRVALSSSNDHAAGVAALPSPSPLARAQAAPTAVAVTLSAPTAATIARPAALQLCVGCHETGAAPLLPFSDATQLTQQLRVRPSAHGALIDEIRFRLSAAAGAQHMPLGLNLADADRESLEDYFVALAAAPD